jgi:hypothetical protein
VQHGAHGSNKMSAIVLLDQYDEVPRSALDAPSEQKNTPRIELIDVAPLASVLGFATRAPSRRCSPGASGAPGSWRRTNRS